MRYLLSDVVEPYDVEQIKKEIKKYLETHKERDHYNTRPQRDPDKIYPSAYMVIDNPHLKFPTLNEYSKKFRFPIIESKSSRILAGYKVPIHVDTFHGVKIQLPMIIPEPGTTCFQIHAGHIDDVEKWDNIDEEKFPIVERYYQYEGLPYYSHGTEIHSVSRVKNHDRTVIQLHVDPIISMEEFEEAIRTNTLMLGRTKIL